MPKKMTNASKSLPNRPKPTRKKYANSRKKYVNFRNNAKIGISYRGHFGKPIQIWPNLWLELSASGKTT